MVAEDIFQIIAIQEDHLSIIIPLWDCPAREIEIRVFSAVDYAHAALAQPFEDFVVRNGLADHRFRPLLIRFIRQGGIDPDRGGRRLGEDLREDDSRCSAVERYLTCRCDSDSGKKPSHEWHE
jgi:hypothetical protein